MWETVREWTIDNPFFRLEWKRWLRQAGPWQALGGGTGLLCLCLLGFHVLYLAASPFGRAFLNRPFSASIFFALVFLQFFGWLGTSVPGFRLDAEAQEHRLEFIRLLPGDPREVLLRIGAARSLLRALMLFAPLPVFLTLSWYGHPPFEDMRSAFLLLMLALFGLPSPSEVGSALRAAEGWIQPGTGASNATPATADPERETPASVEGAFVRRLLLLGGAGAGLSLLLAAAQAWPRGAAPIADSFVRVLHQLLDKNYVAAVVLWIGEPRPFYLGELAPLWVLAVFWLIREGIRAQEAGELWARGLDPALGADGSLLPEELGFPPENVPQTPAHRAVRLYQLIALPLGTLLVLGFLWRGWMLSGSLGRWIGVPTVGGSLAALLVILTTLAYLLYFEMHRCAHEEKEEAPGKALRGAGSAMAKTLGAVLLFVLVVGLAGGTFPLRAVLAPVPGLLAGAAALLAFGEGWRLFRNRWLLGSAGPLTVLFRGILHGLFWIGTYLVPLAVLGGWAVHPLAHRAASLSPVYGLMLPFPALHGATALSPIEATLAPVLVGLVLAGAGLLRKRPENDPELGTRDPLFSALVRTANEWDNPVFSLALRRRAIVREHLTARVLRSPIALLLISGAAAGYFVMQATRRTGLSPAAVLEQPILFAPGLNRGAFVALLAAFAVTVISSMFSSGWSTAIGEETLGNRRRQQKEDLRLSPLTDAEILRGTLWGTLIEPLPGQIMAPVTSLIWIVAAVAYGAGAYWLVVWLGAAGTMLGMGLLAALHSFDHWSRKARSRSFFAYLAATGPVVFILGLLSTPALLQFPRAVPYLPVVLPFLALLSAGATFSQVPVTFRQAERAVRESREETG